MSLRHEIIGLLLYRPSTGYELTKLINSDGMFFWQAQQSQVYREITKLEKDGMIEASPESTGTKKIFKTTELGQLELEEWLNTSDIPSALEVRNPLVMRMFFAKHGDINRTIAELEEYKAECKRMLEEIANYTPELRELSSEKMDAVFFSLNSYYGVGFYTFSIEWAEKCLKILKQLASMN